MRYKDFKSMFDSIKANSNAYLGTDYTQRSLKDLNRGWIPFDMAELEKDMRWHAKRDFETNYRLPGNTSSNNFERFMNGRFNTLTPKEMRSMKLRGPIRDSDYAGLEDADAHSMKMMDHEIMDMYNRGYQPRVKKNAKMNIDHFTKFMEGRYDELTPRDMRVLKAHMDAPGEDFYDPNDAALTHAENMSDAATHNEFMSRYEEAYPLRAGKPADFLKATPATGGANTGIYDLLEAHSVPMENRGLVSQLIRSGHNPNEVFNIAHDGQSLNALRRAGTGAAETEISQILKALIKGAK